MDFSIIIPAYNEQNYIGKCLKSVADLKVPAGSSFEAIVANNASTDRTVEVAKTAFPRVIIVDEPQKGLTRAYNRGAREAKGEILLFVDADMVLPPNHLERIQRKFQKNPRLVAVSGPCLWKDGGWWCYLVTKSVFLFFVMPAEIILNRFLNVGADIASGNSAVKKEFFDKAGGFNENIFYGLEADFAIRVKKFGQVRFKHDLGTETSARRLKKEGIFRMLGRYTMNVIWLHFFHKPFTKNYIDVR